MNRPPIVPTAAIAVALLVPAVRAQQVHVLASGQQEVSRGARPGRSGR